MNPAEVRKMLSYNDYHFYAKEERFADKGTRVKKKRFKKGKREKPEWKRR